MAKVKKENEGNGEGTGGSVAEVNVMNLQLSWMQRNALVRY